MIAISSKLQSVVTKNKGIPCVGRTNNNSYVVSCMGMWMHEHAQGHRVG